MFQVALFSPSSFHISIYLGNEGFDMLETTNSSESSFEANILEHLHYNTNATSMLNTTTIS
jgi:hypothetical protein